MLNNSGEFGQFLIEYVKQVDVLLSLISSCRDRNWLKYLDSVYATLKYSFSRDLQWYARLNTVYHGKMRSLEESDPDVWENFMSGDFVVQKSDIPFTSLFTDQALEQEIKILKRHGGIKGVTQDENVLDRLVATMPVLSRIVKSFMGGFPKANISKREADLQHHQLSGNTNVRMAANALKIKTSMLQYCGANPFSTPLELKSIASSAVIPDDAKVDILQFAVKGNQRLLEFIDDRLLENSTGSVWDSLQWMNLKTFTNFMPKLTISLGETIIKLREERQLLSRFLVILGCRPGIVPKLDSTIGSYEMSVVVRSLCTNDGSLYIPNDKASLMNTMTDIHGPIDKTEDLHTVQYHSKKVMVFDMMAVLQSMKKTAGMKLLVDLLHAVCQRLENMAAGCVEIRCLFDEYADDDESLSLKSNTRKKRTSRTGSKSKQPQSFTPHLNSKLIMSIAELLSASKTKKVLVPLVAQYIQDYFKDKAINVIVAFEQKIVGANFSEAHGHEEADVLIPHQVLAIAAYEEPHDIVVISPDTDVYTLLMDLVANDRLPPRHTLMMTTRTKRQPAIDIIHNVARLGKKKARALIGRFILI